MSSANQSNGTTNASVEVVSENGPMPINVMMQEGVKALTKILSNQLQDRQAFHNAPHAMQFVIRNGGKVLQMRDWKNSKMHFLRWIVEPRR